MIPPQPVEKKPGQLEKWQLEEFFDKGFLQVNNFFTKEELQPALNVSQYATVKPLSGVYMLLDCHPPDSDTMHNYSPQDAAFSPGPGDEATHLTCLMRQPLLYIPLLL